MCNKEVYLSTGRNIFNDRFTLIRQSDARLSQGLSWVCVFTEKNETKTER